MPESYHLIMSHLPACTRYFVLILPLIGLLLTTLNLHVQIPEIGPWWIPVDQSGAAVA